MSVLSLVGVLCRPRTESPESAFERGRRVGRAEAVDHLRTGARLYQGRVGDARRRGALNLAAAQIDAGQEPGRPA